MIDIISPLKEARPERRWDRRVSATIRGECQKGRDFVREAPGHAAIGNGTGDDAQNNGVDPAISHKRSVSYPPDVPYASIAQIPKGKQSWPPLGQYTDTK
jgi:hypothetical protein